MGVPLTYETLREENLAFMDSGGISQSNWAHGFLPAFRDEETGVVSLARFASGAPAPFHLFDGLPAEWVIRRSPLGQVLAIKVSVVAGFVRDGCFFTREQAASQMKC